MKFSYDAFLENLRSTEDQACAIKGAISSGTASLNDLHAAAGNGLEVCRMYTSLIDGILRALFETKASGCAPTALVALGGYGRAELNIRSDIDLMLLYGKKLTPDIEEFNKRILYVLWDTGLDLGFSIRSIDECVALAREDIKTMTALLDLRLIAGSEELYARLRSAVRKKLFGKKSARAFIDEKIGENSKRHEKYGGSVYILEPNVKEGEGGLRDLHTARWALRAYNGSPFEPFSLGLITESDKERLESSVDFLLWVRNDLHFATGRKNDQLSFDHQERMARSLAFETTEHSLAVEAFMQRYYTHATTISRYSGLILSRFLHREDKKGISWPKKKVRVDKDFSVSGGVLAARGPDAFGPDGLAAMKAFEYSQAFGVEIDQATRDYIIAFAETAGDAFATSSAVSESFLKILKGGNSYRALREMLRIGLLGAYIPELKEITCKVQHDMYHVYTVDAHTLFAMRELERLRGENKSAFALMATLYEELPNPEVLALGVLFHDIGKGRGKGHAEKGAAMVPEICSRLHLPEDDANTVRFLVKNHLLLADTAQYRDLHDEKLIIEFARTVGDIERLNLLYLLTFADVRAVGPDVWNQWKGALFQELYFKALTVLERGTFELEEAEPKIRRTKARVAELLAPDGIDSEKVDEYFSLLPQRYFLANGADLIAGHMLALRSFEGRPYSMTVRQDTFREYTELVICTHDLHGLFSMITGVMASNAVNILGAQINTLKNGVVLDILQVTTAYGERITDEAKLKRIEADLAGVVTGRVKVDSLVARRKPSILDRRPKPRVKAVVQVDNDVSDQYTVLDIHAQNRIGLLYDITSALSRLGLYIYVAKITTKGEEAADIFYVKDIFGQKVYYKDRLKDIADAIYAALNEAVSP